MIMKTIMLEGSLVHYLYTKLDILSHQTAVFLIDLSNGFTSTTAIENTPFKLNSSDDITLLQFSYISYIVFECYCKATTDRIWPCLLSTTVFFSELLELLLID